ncbi:MAG: hypothetical protein DDT42_01313 [candidate division WS2 bacterium]|uniref:Uncharacterized protein n=1 Tax=Psychracetigena formicireducens TaxID=2986056 RepID=A0A9E2BH57_PSYF1|nr:hypothetical protein [Candidatus Psychracetigena formicireducens]MBT9145442.1 hypothetical protein [Candidatus Psychracetigena formicireducens]
MNFENITRKEMLKRYSRLITQRDELIWSEVETEEVEFPEGIDSTTQFINIDDQSTPIDEEIYQLGETYRNSLPDLAISRCPFTGQVLNYYIDNEGLDGLWWNFYDPVRKDTPAMETFLTLTGAMKINQPLDNTDFLVEVGPEIPYVLPELLNDENTLAVLSSFKIGVHTAFVVVYFSKKPSSVILRPDEWSTDRYYYQDENGEVVWSQADEIMKIKDFDLVPWIEAGKLFWILPEDRELNLRADVRQCPYIGLTGNKNTQIIQNGELSELETDDELDSEVEEIVSGLELENDKDLTPIPEELWKLLPEEGGNNEQ